MSSRQSCRSRRPNLPAQPAGLRSGRLLIEGTRDRYFGSGFAAAERFLQLLLPGAALRSLLGDTDLNLASAHNMFLSAWVGTGLVGITLALTVLESAANWVHKLPAAGRRFGLSVIFVLVLNGMTTPGIFSAWSVYTLAFVAVLAYCARRRRPAVSAQRRRQGRAGGAAAADRPGSCRPHGLLMRSRSRTATTRNWSVS